jgi:hypothetical protein
MHSGDLIAVNITVRIKFVPIAPGVPGSPINPSGKTLAVDIIPDTSPAVAN